MKSFSPIKKKKSRREREKPEKKGKKKKLNKTLIPLFISGPKRCSIETYEYDDADTAARYPFLDVSSSGFATSGPLASECTSTSILAPPMAFSRLAAHSETVNPLPAAAA